MNTTTDLFVLVSGDGDELSFREGLTADHLLDAPNLHDVYPRLIFVQRIQHDLQKHRCLISFSNIFADITVSVEANH